MQVKVTKIKTCFLEEIRIAEVSRGHPGLLTRGFRGLLYKKIGMIFTIPIY